MKKDLTVLRNFLSETKKNEYKLITSEVYDSIGSLITTGENVSEMATTLRIISGYVDNIKLYKSKEYDEGFDTYINGLYSTINKALEKLCEKE